jgi:pimeloyl-ACP methyl ester carboxylesterase
MKTSWLLLGLSVATTPGAFAQTDTTTFRSEDVTYWNTADSVKLAGTLTIPNYPTRKRFPAMVIVSGSGPEDRDGVSAVVRRGPKVYKALAEYLSARGFAVLRFDDRGVGGSTAGKKPVNQTTTEDVARDGAAGVAFLRTQSVVSPEKVGLAGHSEGSDAAAMVAAADPRVAFVVSLAGAGVPGGRLMVQQNRDVLRSQRFDSTLTEAYTTAFYQPWIEQIARNNDTASLRRVVREGFLRLRTRLDSASLVKLGVVAGREKAAIEQLTAMGSLPWMRYFVTHDPATDWQRVRCPVLALNGTLDVQVNADQNLAAIESALRKGGNRSVKTVKMPGLNHLFQHAKTGTIAEYFTLKDDFAPEALRLIADWLRQTVR